MRMTIKTYQALLRLKFDVCYQFHNLGHDTAAPNGTNRDILEDAFRLALLWQGCSLEDAWEGAFELGRATPAVVVREWLAAYRDEHSIEARQQRSIGAVFEPPLPTAELAFSSFKDDCERSSRAPAPSLRTFQRRVRMERRLLSIMQRLRNRQAKRMRALERERARMPQASDFIGRILDIAEAEGFRVARPGRS